MNIEIDKSGANMAFDLMKYIAAGALLALSPLIVGWLIACIIGTVNTEHDGAWGFWCGLALAFGMLCSFIAFMNDTKTDDVTISNGIAHMTKWVAIMAAFIIIPIFITAMAMNLFGGIGVIVAVLMLIGSVFGIIGYFNSHEYKKEKSK